MRERLEHLHRPLLGLIAVLCLFGLLMMASAGGGDVRLYTLPQLGKMVVGAGMMLLIATAPQSWLYRAAYPFYIVMLLLLVGVDIAGHIGMGAQRWLKLGGLNVQPSEFMKIAVILAMARYFHGLTIEDTRRIKSLIPALILLALPAVLILRQPNLGTTVVVVGIGVGMMFMAGVLYRYFIGGALLVAAMLPVAWHFLHDYQRQRVMTFLEPAADPLGSGYNILQSMIAIGSGGFLGKGFMEGSQGQLNFLPEKHTDFIFTMVTEEWGFMGGMAVIMAFGVLIAMALSVAGNSRTTFSSLLATGVAMMVLVHVFINIAMVMGLLPVVGLPLPFLSYGGSMLLSSLLAMGLLLNAHRCQKAPLLMSGIG